MSYANFSEFINMGGYGSYVWSSFGLCALAVLIECLTLRRQRKNTLARLRGELYEIEQSNVSIESTQP